MSDIEPLKPKSLGFTVEISGSIVKEGQLQVKSAGTILGKHRFISSNSEFMFNINTRKPNAQSINEYQKLLPSHTIICFWCFILSQTFLDSWDDRVVTIDKKQLIIYKKRGAPVFFYSICLLWLIFV